MSHYTELIRVELREDGAVLRKSGYSVVPCQQPSDVPMCDENLDQLMSKKDIKVNVQSPFLESEHGFMHKLMKDGIMATVREYVNTELYSEDNKKPAVLNSILSALSYIGTKLPAVFTTQQGPFDKYLTTYQWSHSLVKALCWHPNTSKLAVAYCDNSVRLFSNVSRIVPHLKHKLQKNITALAWQPFSSSVLAIGCRTCILIWRIDSLFMSARPNSSTVQVLERHEHNNITCINWSPGGNMLLSCSSNDKSLHVWNIHSETSDRLTRASGGGTVYAQFSPTSDWIVCLTTSNKIRLWNTSTWLCDHWSHGTDDRWTSCCFSSDSQTLLLVNGNSTIVYLLPCQREGGAMKTTARPLFDLMEVLAEDVLTKLQKITIRNMKWNRTSQHLAVFVTGHDDVSYLLIFTTDFGLSLTWDITFRCIIEGEFGRFITTFDFKQDESDRHILTAAWNNGEVKHLLLDDILSYNVNTSGRHEEPQSSILYSTQRRSPN